MDSCDSGHLSSSREANSKVVDEIVGDKIDEKIVQLNSKDDLNWVENEIVVVDSLNDKLTTGFTSVDSNKSCNDNVNYQREYTADGKFSSSKEKKSETLVRTSDDSETKLWEYFTEYNSSQLRCNLCMGLFLYQNDAAYLLKHIEVVHKITVLANSMALGNDNCLTDSETFKNSSSLPSSDIQLNENTENKEGKHDDSQGCATVISSNLSVETEKLTKNIKVWRYFTRLETGKIRCNLCCRVLPYNSNESTIIRHLKSNHRDIYQCSIDLSNNDNVLKSNDLCDLSVVSKPSQKKGANKIKSKNRVIEYFTRLEACGRMQCKFCNAVVKYSEGIDTNLIRHLKTKHKRIMNKNYSLRFSDNEKKLSSDTKEKDTGSIIVLEILEDGDNCLITNAQLQTESDQTVLTEVTNSVASISNCGIDGVESNRECDLFENVNQIGNICENVNKKMAKTDAKIIGHNVNIWDYFTKLTTTNNKARCNICSVILCCKNSVNKLFHHLSAKHRNSFVNYSKPSNDMVDFEIVESESEWHDDKNPNVEYKITGELTVEDISNINLSSILYPENDNHWIKSKKQSKFRGNIVGKLWKYYTKLYRGKVMCNLCGKSFIHKLGQITNLITHLRLNHKFIFVKFNIKPRIENLNNSSSNRVNSSEAMKRVNKTDVVWKFFTKLDKSKAECNLCEHINVFYYSSSSRSNLMKHLRRKHRYFLDLNRNDKLKLFKDENTAVQNNDSNIHNTGEDSDNHLSQPGINMKALFDYFSADKNLEKHIKFEKEQIVCKLCTGMFLFDDLLNFEYTIKYHVQTCHADTSSHNTSVFLDNCLSDDELNLSEEIDEMSDSSSYNELQAISTEINSYGN